MGWVGRGAGAAAAAGGAAGQACGSNWEHGTHGIMPVAPLWMCTWVCDRNPVVAHSTACGCGPSATEAGSAAGHLEHCPRCIFCHTSGLQWGGSMAAHWAVQAQSECAPN